MLWMPAAWLAALIGAGAPAAEVAALEGALEQVALTADLDDADRFREAAFALRLARQASQADPAYRSDLLSWLEARPELAETLAFLVREEAEEAAEVYALLERLRRERAERVERYPELAAAICVVHDRPLSRRVNENQAHAPDPVEILDYFCVNEKRMLFGVRDVPAELLVLVVDSTASVEEMLWALSRHAGDAEVGARFFDIAYDHEHYRTGAPKRVTVAGWNLPNILRYGGVCGDQAYYAMSVGKAIGVPTAYAIGRGGTNRHAWVGFLQARGGQARWNFDTGRYEEYRGVRGSVRDPQTRRYVADSAVSLLAELARVPRRDRHAAAAYADAARVLAAADEPDVERVLALLEAGLRRSPGHAPGWLLLGRLAAEGALTLEQKQRWAGVLSRLCADRYPDFYFDVVAPMIDSIERPQERDKLWSRAFAVFRDRHDLAAAALAARARVWEEAGEPHKAGRFYEEIIARYANAGPFVVDALAKAESLLADDAARPRKVLNLYRQAFDRIERPQSMAGPFFRQSNWYRVGSRYAERLEKAGLARDAAGVRRLVGSP